MVISRGDQVPVQKRTDQDTLHLLPAGRARTEAELRMRQNQTFLSHWKCQTAPCYVSKVGRPLEKGKDKPLTQTLRKRKDSNIFHQQLFLPQGAWSLDTRSGHGKIHLQSYIYLRGLQLTVPSAWNTLLLVLTVFHSLCSGVCSKSLCGGSLHPDPAFTHQAPAVIISFIIFPSTGMLKDFVSFPAVLSMPVCLVHSRCFLMFVD